MRTMRKTAVATIFVFLLSTVSGAITALEAQSGTEGDEIARLVQEADEAYRNGSFNLAIDKYREAMRLITEKKELVQTKQALFQTMISLALTYFTIQENAKAEKQLEDLVRASPKQELDPEFYPPKFLEIFRAVQRNSLGRLAVASMPAGAAILLDGAKVGQAPLELEKVLKGMHEIQAELEGYAPVRREILVQAATDNTVEIELEVVKPVVEKKVSPAAVPAKKKKKKFSPLIIVGGAAVAALAVVLLSGKKSEPEKQLQSRAFSEMNPTRIDILLPTYLPLEVSDIPARIERIEFLVRIEHPGHMEDLNVSIVGTDGHTLFNIWNRDQASESPTVIKGGTDAFNALAPNGIWRLLVQNPGRSAGGQILEFTLKIYFYR
ncbi:MAG: PEGA domain-containing protein [Candidatus Aminicenantes bacterium]|nr:PEGA domain-containing protein [Candidatus Aminicenantes bacterium]